MISFAFCLLPFAYDQVLIICKKKKKRCRINSLQFQLVRCRKARAKKIKALEIMTKIKIGQIDSRYEYMRCLLVKFIVIGSERRIGAWVNDCKRHFSPRQEEMIHWQVTLGPFQIPKQYQYAYRHKQLLQFLVATFK